MNDTLKKLNLISNYLLHPKLRSVSHPDHKKAIIVSWVMVVLLFFIVIYDGYFIWFKYADTTKNLTNLFGHLLFLANIFIFRITGNYKFSLSTLVILSLGPTMHSTYHTGGLFSVDYAWLLLTVMGAFVFIGIFTGVITAFLVMLYTFVLFWIDTQNLNKQYFEAYFLKFDPIHHLLTIVFVLVMMSILLSVFINILQKTTQKLEKLQDFQIGELEIKLNRKTVEMSKLRSNLARDFHDEMGNKLASINIISQLIAHRLKDKKHELEIDKLLVDIGDRAKEVFEGTKDFIWSIDFKSDYVTELFIYLREFGEVFFMNIDVNFNAFIDEEISKNARLDIEANRQVIFSCKEIMTNAAKHSDCSEIEFSFIKQELNLEIKIIDNGIGFDVSAAYTRGVLNVQNRIISLGGSALWEYKNAKTVVTLLIPFSADTIQKG